MKILYLNMYFKLPDDFDGNYNDALQEYLDYRRTNSLPDHKIGFTERTTLLEELDKRVPDELWPWFLRAVDEGQRMCGNVSFCEVRYAPQQEVNRNQKEQT